MAAASRLAECLCLASHEGTHLILTTPAGQATEVPLSQRLRRGTESLVHLAKLSS